MTRVRADALDRLGKKERSKPQIVVVCLTAFGACTMEAKWSESRAIHPDTWFTAAGGQSCIELGCGSG